MGSNIVEVKVLPESKSTNLEKIKREIKNKLPEAANIKVDTQEIAFGLKSLQVLIAWPEEKNSDEIENRIQKIKGVSSARVESIRRAIG